MKYQEKRKKKEDEIKEPIILEDKSRYLESTPFYISNVFGLSLVEENARIVGDFLLQYLHLPNIEVRKRHRDPWI
jgi:hypothetical protein